MARILVVEDNKNLGFMEAVALKHEGFHVEVADNGTDAKNLILEQHFDVIVLDILLPGMTGLELAEIAKLRKAKPPKVILLSGVVAGGGSAAGQQLADSVHADAYLGKPLSLTKLVEKVRELMC